MTQKLNGEITSQGPSITFWISPYDGTPKMIAEAGTIFPRTLRGFWLKFLRERSLLNEQ
jgi:hypothetical protein